MVEVDAVEDLIEFAKIKRLDRTVPQLTKTSKGKVVGIAYLEYQEF